MRKHPPGSAPLVRAAPAISLVKKFAIRNMFSVEQAEASLEPLTFLESSEDLWSGHLWDILEVWRLCTVLNVSDLVYHSSKTTGVRRGKPASEPSALMLEIEGSPRSKQKEEQNRGLPLGAKLIYELRFSSPSEDYKKTRRWESLLMRNEQGIISGYELWGAQQGSFVLMNGWWKETNEHTGSRTSM